MPKDAAFIQLEAGEDANSVRDRLQFLRGQHVLIVWPEVGTALTRKLDLVLVQREAMRRAIRVAFVTHDPQIIEYARELDISTFETIGASQRGRWKRGRSKVFANRSQKPKDEPTPADLMPLASRVRAGSRIPLPFLARLVMLAIVSGVLALAAYVVLPGATVSLTLARRDIFADVVISASPRMQAIDVENSRIPARFQLVQVVQSGTYPSTGQLAGEDTLATGTVTIVNRTSTPREIPAGTVVSTADGAPVRFRLLTTALLPGGEGLSVEVRVEALPEFAGEIGNVAAARITALETDFADTVTVTNLLPLSGGQSRTLPVVTQTDIDRLRAAVRQQIQAQAQADIGQLLAEGEFFIDESIAITPESERADWQVYSANVGDVANEVTLEMRAVVQALVINQRDAERVGFAALSQQIPRGRSLDVGTLRYERGPIMSLSEDGEVSFQLYAEGMISGSIDGAELQQFLAGRSLPDARLYLASTLELAPGSEPQISVFPQFGDSMPLLPFRITVDIQEAPAP
ncbi:MAG: baseplate J/gp47 family protein [Chloroflexi bacterium]|nr:MAG: hypothetical protein UZ13_02432 [Chloroflexi bacterium OLB13]MBC6955407.1 hypothetical protein [Chloroflexota bacterium]MBV6435409.1 hypothetical protein [Anaerolineae bacterium]MDL1915299.1 hypothetical protein [Anaerolineae bacterium CFX4]OQY80107.1 MAG: hypothetical protein B6D42_13500 [Anaerolineae bacterium UTCFX5]